jgi:hypothetical protein
MVTVCFRCPKCRMHVIRGLVCSDDVLALTGDLPIRLRCPGCGTESFVLQHSRYNRALPREGEWDSTVGHCLTIAAICRLGAGAIQTTDARAFLLKMERQWLELGQRCDVHQRCAIVRARVTRLWRRGRWRQSA